MNRHPVIATGHPETTAAAAEMLNDGGNAFDACISAALVACVVEPMLCSLGGGGFLLARQAGHAPQLVDFFVQTPGSKNTGEIDFFPIIGEFGEATQEFHIGLGSMAAPGLVRGLFHIHRQYARLPIKRLFEPAIRLARDGVALNAHQAYTLAILKPILSVSSTARENFFDGDRPRTEGAVVRLMELSEFLSELAGEGEEFFYQGPAARQLVEHCQHSGGHLQQNDLDEYQVQVRQPLSWQIGDARLWSNPAPSSGGGLVAYASCILAEAAGAGHQFDLRYVQSVVQSQQMTNQLRKQSDWNRILEDQLSQAGARGITSQADDQAHCERGTTQISIIDWQGSVASMSISNGEGCGFVIPGTGIMMNNMLGEEDINPAGFHQWPENQRVSSMMSPVIADLPGGSQIALGSGGANRIRTAITQVLAQRILLQQSLTEAVMAPRIHLEDRRLNWEDAGFPEAASDWLAEAFSDQVRWSGRNLFFGGVHAVEQNITTGIAEGVGDKRRGGDWTLV